MTQLDKTPEQDPYTLRQDGFRSSVFRGYAILFCLAMLPVVAFVLFAQKALSTGGGGTGDFVKDLASPWSQAIERASSRTKLVKELAATRKIDRLEMVKRIRTEVIPSYQLALDLVERYQKAGPTTLPMVQLYRLIGRRAVKYFSEVAEALEGNQVDLLAKLDSAYASDIKYFDSIETEIRAAWREGRRWSWPSPTPGQH